MPDKKRTISLHLCWGLWLGCVVALQLIYGNSCSRFPQVEIICNRVLTATSQAIEDSGSIATV